MNINYFVFGTNDMPKAVKFYDGIFESSGVNKVHDEGRMTLWSAGDFMFALAEPFNGEAATFGNGSGKPWTSIPTIARSPRPTRDSGPHKQAMCQGDTA